LIRQFGLALLFLLSTQQDSSELLFAFSVSEEILSGEKASFLPPLALLGYIPIPTFCSYCPQTPSTNGDTEPLERVRQALNQEPGCSDRKLGRLTNLAPATAKKLREQIDAEQSAAVSNAY
jgi:hypothetical protein